VLSEYNQSSYSEVQSHLNFVRPLVQRPGDLATGAVVDDAVTFLVQTTSSPFLLPVLILALKYEHEQEGHVGCLPQTELQLYDMAIASSVRTHAKVGAEKKKLDNAESMVRAVGTGNHVVQRDSFDSTQVDTLLEAMPDELKLWHMIIGNRRRVPLIRSLAAQTVKQPAQHRFEHQPFQHAIRAANILSNYQTWDGWESDASAASFLNEPFNEVSCTPIIVLIISNLGLLLIIATLCPFFVRMCAKLARLRWDKPLLRGVQSGNSVKRKDPY
jgi:hypothetical protein